MINFCCVSYGTKYRPEYVQKLYNMVERHLTLPYKFICFTDQHQLLKRQVKGDVEYRTFRDHTLHGYWNKLQLFSPDSNLEGNTLYMDLDVVIMKNIDDMATIGESKNFVGMNDFNPTSGLFNSSIMRFNNKYHSVIWEQYLKRKTEFNSSHGDQEIITALIKKHEDTISFPDEWTQSYKWLNRNGDRYHISKQTYEQDPNAKVCVFHGSPNPHDSAQEWVQKLWK